MSEKGGTAKSRAWCPWRLISMFVVIFWAISCTKITYRKRAGAGTAPDGEVEKVVDVGQRKMD